MKRTPLSLEQQGLLMEDIVRRCTMRDGATAGEAVLMLTADDVGHLRDLEARLKRMARHEDAIRELVMTRR